jgi:hypothetical protein
MADRYWVGGAGNWSSTTKWSTTSGGGSGASVPGSLDTAIFDANSGGKFTATVDTAQTVSGISITPSAAAGVLQIALSAKLSTGTLTTTGTAGNNRIWFRGTTYGIAIDFAISGAVSISDCDFRDVYVTGASSPISGTRIGNLGGCTGITFSAAKTVYWNLAGAQDWSANGWAATSGGSPNTDNFPLAQDTATFDNTGSVTGTISFSTTFVYTGTVDMSARTTAMTLSIGTGITVYGDWKNGSGTTLSGANEITFSGRSTQTITSAGKTFSGSIAVNSYGGTVQLADALNLGSNDLTVTSGTFDTKNFTVTALGLISSNSNVRTITLGSSTLTLSGSVSFVTSTNLTLNAGTSTLNLSATGVSYGFGGKTLYNISFTNTAAGITVISGSNVFNNVSITAPSAAGLRQLQLSADQTINGTLTVAGATAVRRIFAQSDTVGTTRTLTVNSLSATDCDFRDITIAGAAAGSSPTRAGDCGGNTGITFPGAKTVYWNLAGAQNWSATGWCPSSGGTPDINQFPLAQDTAVFDNTGSVTGTITINTAWNIGTFDASTRTTAMTLSAGTGIPYVYGDWKFGTGVTSSSTTATITFGKRGTQTITSNGVTFGCNVTFESINGTTQLASAFAIGSTRIAGLSAGTFDAVSYNVTVGLFNPTTTTSTRTLKLGSGTWTLSGTGTIWDASNTSGLTFNKNTANITLSDTSTSARTFAGGALSYNQLTIGGSTGTSTTTITSNNQFTELASTKSVAHTIALGTTTQTFGSWTVKGTAGNVVTVSGTATITIAGGATSGLDYLSLGTTVISTTSPGEFYAGVNSTGGTNAILTAPPTPRTLFWVGGTGNWDNTSTTNWSLTSGGSGGQSPPVSLDSVIFNTSSNPTSYTVTISANVRCDQLLINSGPASGTLTLAGTSALSIHNSATFPATGFSRTYTGTITLTSNTTGRTFTTNGVTVSTIVVNGVGCGWSLGGALSASGFNIILTNGSFDTAGYAVTSLDFNSNNTNSRTLTLGASTWTISQTSGALSLNTTNLTTSIGTSSFVFTSASPGLNLNSTGPLTLYDVSCTNTALSTVSVLGSFSFRNLTFAGRTSAGVGNISLNSNQTITGTLTFSAGTDATMRNFLRSNTFGTTRTLTCAAFSGTDVDFQDITIAGAAAPVSGTRLGDCKGNSGITFDAGVTRYWNLVGGGNWSATGWAATSGGSPAANNFPLAQDTALFESTGLTSGSTITINAAYNIGTINMSARTSNTMTLATGSTTPTIYGNWTNGTGTTLSGTGVVTWAGRGSQTITSAGKTFTQPITINTPGGSVTLQDAFISNISGSATFDLSFGTFDANNFNVTLSGANTNFASTASTTRTLALGSGTWTLAGAVWSTNGGLTGLTITGSPTITMTSASTKTFAGGGSTQYSGVTLNQGGAGTLTITGNNTFKDITNTYSATGATNITLGTTTQTVTQFTGTGTVGNVLTIQGTSASSPGTLVLTGAIKPNVDYLTITGVRAYSLDTTWYAGANSTNNGSLGWIFASGTVALTGFITEGASGADSIAGAIVAAIAAFITEGASGLDEILSSNAFGGSISEAASGLDSQSSNIMFTLSVDEAASGLDAIVSSILMEAIVSEVASALDDLGIGGTFNIVVSEVASGQDGISNIGTFNIVITEAATGVDILTARLLWEPIDNQQTANWTDITNSQTPGWTDIPTQ